MQEAISQAKAAGAPTIGAAEAMEGVVLPMAGRKGYVVAVMMDMLSGVLTGSAFDIGVRGPYQARHRSGAGQFMTVLDTNAFGLWLSSSPARKATSLS